LAAAHISRVNCAGKAEDRQRSQIWILFQNANAVILLHVVSFCPGGRTAAVARHVSLAQITCNSIIQFS